MHWRIKLTDDNSRFWLVDQPRKVWSDDADQALRFTCLEEAYAAADLARGRVAHYEVQPRVKIVKFLD